MSDDYFVEDILKNVDKPKKLNSGRKGKTGERELCKILSERFNSSFFRVVGSGNRWAQVELTENAKSVLTGDVVCPPRFRFAIECKFGYEDIDLFSLIEKGNKKLDGFLDQAIQAAQSQGKWPMLCWKKPRMPWMCFVYKGIPELDYPYKLLYRDFVGVSLNLFLKEGDCLFFQGDPDVAGKT